MLMFHSANSLKTSRVLMAGIFLFIALACSRLGNTPAPAPEPESFGYCGARLTRLCIVSFGRDVFGDTVVNLFVPRRTYPAFHLNIVRKSGADIYECIWSGVDETSVYCTGKALNLDEGIEIQLLAKLDNRLLARGTFTVNAFLVTTPVADDAETPAEEDGFGSTEGGIQTADPDSQQETEEPTSTPGPADKNRPTATPRDSYPNYP